MLRKISLVAVCLAALVSATVRVSATPDVTVDDVIAKVVKALGGAEKRKAVKSVKRTGKFIFGGGQAEGPAILLQKRPNKFRLDISIGGASVVQAYDGTTGWQNLPAIAGGSGKPEKMSADDLQDIEENADIDGDFIDYKAKGKTIELVGKEELEGSPVYVLKVTDKYSKTQTVYVDADSGFILKIKSKTKRGGNEFEQETYLSDYKEVNGLYFEFNIETKINGRTIQQIVTEKVELDGTVDDAQFAFPAEKPADKPAETKPSGK
jgi:outer membrane lipoprotein-sorting protein